MSALEEWLAGVGREAIAELAEDMPGGPHGRKKGDMIAWILSDEEATEYATSAMDLNVHLDSTITTPTEVGFVDSKGDAL